MSRFLVAVLGALLIVGVGCSDKDKSDSGSSVKASSADVCKHCPGDQKATADGKCPVCGAKVSAADACPKCAGVQTAKADGTCPGCGAKVAVDACAHCAGVQVANAAGKCPGCGADLSKKQ
jgi:hypothetical protein